MHSGYRIRALVKVELGFDRGSMALSTCVVIAKVKPSYQIVLYLTHLQLQCNQI